MNKFLILIMFLLVSGSLSTMIHQNQLITIQTNDNQEFEIPINVANTSKTIKDMLKDIGIHNKEKEDELPISLPMISSTQFNLILPAMQNLAELYAKESHKNKREILNQHLQTIVTNFKINDQPFNNQQLIAFIAGTNYFDIPLVQPALQELARRALQPYDWLKLELLGDKLIDLWQLHPALKPISFKHSSCDKIMQSSDGKHLISWSSLEGTIKIWDKNNLDQTPIILGHNWCNGIIESLDGQNLISSSWQEGTIKIWNKNNLQEPITLKHRWCNGIIESSNGKRFISWSNQEGDFKVWNKNNLDQDLTFEHPWCSGSIESLDNKRFISWSWGNGTIKIWNKNDHYQDPITLDHFRCDNVIETLSDQKLISFSWQYGTIKIWDMNNPIQIQKPLILQHFRCNNVIESSDGKHLISRSGEEGTIKIWNKDSFYQESISLKHPGCKNVIESLDGQNLISWSNLEKKTIKIWNKNNLQEPPINLYHNLCDEVIETPDNENFISYSKYSIKIWNKNNLAQKPIVLKNTQYKGVLTLFNDVIKSLDGQNIISRSGSSINIWDLTFINPDINSFPSQIPLLLAVYFAAKENQIFDLPVEKRSELKIIFNELPPTTQTFLEKKASNFIAKIKET